MFGLIEPIPLVSFFSRETNDGFRAVGMRNYWDGYFAGRAAALGEASAEVVHAIFYNFADGEVARHIPWVWGRVTPAQALEIRETSSAAALKRILGEVAESRELVRAADLLTLAATAADPVGRPLYAGMRGLPIPEDPVARLWHSATMLREHRGDGHNSALLAAGIGGIEAHVLLALSIDLAPEKFGRIHHLKPEVLGAVIDGMRERGLVSAEGGFTDQGRALKQQVEDETDRLATPPYAAMSAADLTELIDTLTPISERVAAAGSR